jgi:hypothetical protein
MERFFLYLSDVREAACDWIADNFWAILGAALTAYIVISLIMVSGYAGVTPPPAQKRSAPSACEGAHIEDFKVEAAKKNITVEVMRGGYLKAFFIEHIVLTQAPVSVMNLRPVTGMVFTDRPGQAATKAMVVYFGPDGCFLTAQPLPVDLLRELRLKASRANI